MALLLHSLVAGLHAQKEMEPNFGPNNRLNYWYEDQQQEPETTEKPLQSVQYLQESASIKRTLTSKVSTLRSFWYLVSSSSVDLDSSRSAFALAMLLNSVFSSFASPQSGKMAFNEKLEMKKPQQEKHKNTATANHVTGSSLLILEAGHH